MPRFVEFQQGSPLYELVLPLRNRILREPLGLVFTAADFEAERTQLHFALVEPCGEGEQPVASLIAAPLAAGRYQLRQMAVDEARRGAGLGRELVQQVEAVLSDRGATELMLHARVDVVGFYERLGYTAVGAVFIEVTIPHCEMVKRLG